MDDPGLQLRTVAVLHACVGLLIPGLRQPLLEMVTRGWVGTAAVKGTERPLARMTAMWFQVAGAMMWLIGWMMSDMAAAGAAVPAQYGWYLAAMGVLFGLANPVSGFWLVVVIGGNIVRLSG